MLLIEKQYIVMFYVLVYIYNIVCDILQLAFFTQYYVFQIYVDPCEASSFLVTAK